MLLSEGKTISFPTEIRVRYADTDKMGIVYNATYLIYFEIGRTELMRHYGLSYPEFEAAGYFLPLVDSYVKYISPATYDDLLVVTAKLKIELKSTIRFDYEIKCNEKLITTGFTTHSYMKTETMRAVKPPSFFVELIKKIEV